MAGETTPGRRREDVALGDLPDDFQPGDYWKYLERESGEPLHSDEPENLTHGVWGICAPNGFVAVLTKHTVREHEDGTVTVAHMDGSSNSILVERPGTGDSWHGFIDRGVWRTV